MNPVRHALLPLILLATVSSAALHANSISVQEVGVGANETVWINSSNLGSNLHVYAGVLKLKVGGVATNGFCIDPWHWSSGGVLSYQYEPLSNAPKSADGHTPNPMGMLTAREIEQLWARYYSPSIDNITAAALQIEIWKLVDAAVPDGSFSLLSIDGGNAGAVYARIAGMENFLTTCPTATTANLLAVTGAGQDYVIQAVPEAGFTLELFILGLVTLGCLLAVRQRHSRR